jgi:hypothetical protein
MGKRAAAVCERWINSLLLVLWYREGRGQGDLGEVTSLITVLSYHIETELSCLTTLDIIIGQLPNNNSTNIKME